MAENLAFQSGSCYNNNSNNCKKYGKLYAWTVALDVCPDGWHLPSDEDWRILINYLGGEKVAGGKLKEAGTDNWQDPNVGATNESGFTALPGGNQSSSAFKNIGFKTAWWSSKIYMGSNLYHWSVEYDKSEINRRLGYDYYSFSVRCIKD